MDAIFDCLFTWDLSYVYLFIYDGNMVIIFVVIFIFVSLPWLLSQHRSYAAISPVL